MGGQMGYTLCYGGRNGYEGFERYSISANFPSYLRNPLTYVLLNPGDRERDSLYSKILARHEEILYYSVDEIKKGVNENYNFDASWWKTRFTHYIKHIMMIYEIVDKVHLAEGETSLLTALEKEIYIALTQETYVHKQVKWYKTPINYSLAMTNYYTHPFADSEIRGKYETLKFLAINYAGITDMQSKL